MPTHQILCGSIKLDLYPWEKTTGEIRYLKRRSQKDYNFNLTHSNLQNLHEISKKEKRRVYKSIQLNSLKLFLIFSLHPIPSSRFSIVIKKEARGHPPLNKESDMSLSKHNYMELIPLFLDEVECQIVQATDIGVLPSLSRKKA